MADTRPVTQATIFSGRAHCVEPVIKSLLRLSYPDLHRLWLVNGERRLEEYALMFDRLPASVYLGAKVYAQNGTHGQGDLRGKKQAICEAWGELITRAIELGRDLLVIEDDIVVPPDAAQQLQAIAYSWPAGAVSGLTRTNGGAYPLYEYAGPGLYHFNQKPAVPRRYAATGTFCLYLRADVLEKMKATAYKPLWNLRHLAMWGKDCHLGLWLRENRYEWIVTPDVPCEHHVQHADGSVTVFKP